MTERMVLEYVLNAMWQLPLLVAGAAVLLRVTRMEAGAQHGVWMGVLALAVVLPLHGVSGMEGTGLRGWPQAAVASRAKAVDCVGQAPAGSSAGGGDGLGAEPLAAGERVGATMATESKGAWMAQETGRVRTAVEGRLLRARQVEVGPQMLRAVMVLYWLAMMVAAARVWMGWRRAQALVRSAAPVELGETEAAVLRAAAARLGARVPEVRRAPAGRAVAMAAVVGVRRPVLLLGD